MKHFPTETPEETSGDGHMDSSCYSAVGTTQRSEPSAFALKGPEILRRTFVSERDGFLRSSSMIQIPPFFVGSSVLPPFFLVPQIPPFFVSDICCCSQPAGSWLL